MNWLTSFFAYMRQQLPIVPIRHTHGTLAILVIFQILNSNFIQMNAEGSKHSVFLWVHIISGCLAILMTIMLITLMLTKQHFYQFYPYLFKDNLVWLSDIKSLFKFKMPEPKEKGLANVIQGLGIGALILIESVALTWLFLWQTDSIYANDAKNLHKLLTGLIEAYLIGHGGMALLHFWFKRNAFSI